MAKRTIRRRVRKNRTIRKVMRGCNRRRGKRGGGEAVQYAGASPMANQNLAAMQAAAQQAGADANAQTPPPIPPMVMSNQVAGSVTTTPAPAPASGSQAVEPFGVGSNISSRPAQIGGSHHHGRAKTRHYKRKLRYKKSVARKSRRS